MEAELVEFQVDLHIGNDVFDKQVFGTAEPGLCRGMSRDKPCGV